MATNFVRLVRTSQTDTITSGPNGRFHARQPTSYLADTIETARQEIAARLGLRRIKLGGFQTIHVDLVGLDLVDLTDADTRKRYGASSADLTAVPPPRACQELGARLRSEGYDGAIYESARVRGARCVVLFLENAGDRLRVEKTHKKPP